MKWPKVNQLCVLFEKRCVAANALRAGPCLGANTRLEIGLAFEHFCGGS